MDFLWLPMPGNFRGNGMAILIYVNIKFSIHQPLKITRSNKLYTLYPPNVNFAVTPGALGKKRCLVSLGCVIIGKERKP
jgi:hypothetical protein